MDPLATLTTLTTPQNERALGPEGQRQELNHAGGYVFSVDKRTQVMRFLTLGTAGGTYYASQSEHTKENAGVILEAARTDGLWLVTQIFAVSTRGRAPRQSPAIFALAVAASLGDDATRRSALDILPVICRTGTSLFQFITYVQQFRGWGRALRRAVAGWYQEKAVSDLTYQVLKYRQRHGFTHRDALRLAHPSVGLGEETAARAALYEYVCRGQLLQPELLPQARGFVAAQASTNVGELVELIGMHRLSWEMLPDTALKEPKVWRALLRSGIPMGALIRQLPRLTRLGVLQGEVLDLVLAQLGDGERLRRARIHPLNVLVALKTYAGGTSLRGKGTWDPLTRVVDALDAAFYASFSALEPSGKRTLLALDVSGSMSSPAGDLPLSCTEVTAAMTMATLATEPDATVVGFTSGEQRTARMYMNGSALSVLPISARQRLDDIVAKVDRLAFGATDCSLPMTWSGQQNKVFDTIVIYTDNETWWGDIHPYQALKKYREQVGVNTRLVVVGITATKFSIADPLDAATLDVAGFDSAVPDLISNFSRGTLTSGGDSLDV